MSKAALISLLEETDLEIFRSVEAEFLVIGIEAIPLLEKKWEEIDNEVDSNKNCQSHSQDSI